GEILDAEADTVEAQAAQGLQLLETGDPRVHLDGDLRAGGEGEAPAQGRPEPLELGGGQERRRAAAEVNLVNSAHPYQVRVPLRLPSQAGGERPAGVAPRARGRRDDLLGAGAVVAKPLAERDVYVHRQRPPLLRRLVQVGAEVARAVIRPPDRRNGVG